VMDSWEYICRYLPYFPILSFILRRLIVFDSYIPECTISTNASCIVSPYAFLFPEFRMVSPLRTGLHNKEVCH
jgi:hypothetical protein